MKGFADRTKIRFNRHFNCIIGKHGSGKTTLINLIRKSCDSSITEPDGSINLFVEKVKDGKSQYYCFWRGRKMQDFKVFELDLEKGISKELPKSMLDKLSIKPKTYKDERIEEIIANPRNLFGFIEKRFQSGSRKDLAKVFNSFYEKQRFLSSKKKEILKLEESSQGMRLYITIDGKEREFFTLDKGMKKAVIMLILLCSEKFGPVIIDSPESYLDNEGIFDFIVPRIREVKDLQQLILLTGNPNIAVSGDPENIIVLEGKVNRIKKVLTGCSIERKEIKGDVIRILEGGMRAFTSRKIKYEG